MAGGREPAADVEQPADGLRIATRLLGRLVDQPVADGQVARLEIAQAGQPAVGLASYQAQHCGLVRPQPDADVVAGAGPRFAHVREVMLPVEPDAAGSQAQLEPPAAEQVQTGRTACQHGGWAQRQVEDVAADRDRPGLCGHPGQQRPGVEEPGLVRVVGERHQIQAGSFRLLARLTRAGSVVLGVRNDPKSRSCP